MLECLNKIVSVKNICPDAQNFKSSSGYDIWQAPEIKYKGMAAIADEKYIRGREVLLGMRDLAILEVQGDFLKTVASLGYYVDSGVSLYRAAQLNTQYTNAATALKRGITIHSAKPSPLRRIKITEIQVYPVQSMAAEIRILDGNVITSYNVELTGGSINEFPIEYTAVNDNVRIVMDNTNLATYSSEITCMIGCGGTMPNPCGYVTGWDGTGQVKSEGFGISATFGCECDLSTLLCSWSKQYIGEIVWWKTRALVQEERLNSDRLNSFTIYGRDDAEKKFVEFENTYREKWNAFAAALPKLMSNLRDDCITCSRTGYKTNV